MHEAKNAKGPACRALLHADCEYGVLKIRGFSLLDSRTLKHVGGWIV